MPLLQRIHSIYRTCGPSLLLLVFLTIWDSFQNPLSLSDMVGPDQEVSQHHNNTHSSRTKFDQTNHRFISLYWILWQLWTLKFNLLIRIAQRFLSFHIHSTLPPDSSMALQICFAGDLLERYSGLTFWHFALGLAIAFAFAILPLGLFIHQLAVPYDRPVTSQEDILSTSFGILSWDLDS